MTRYVAVIDGEAGAYGAYFPDALGATAMAGTVDDVLVQAAEVLSEWVADEIANGREPPRPRDAAQIAQEREVAEDLAAGRAVLALVPLVLSSGRVVRANISLDSGLLQAVDEAAHRMGLTRSAFLASAAREKIESGA